MPLEAQSNVERPAAAAAVSATFTAEPIEEPLEFWFEELGLDYRIEFAPYNQVFQQLLDPASLLAANRGVNVLLVRFDDWVSGAGPAHLEETLQQFIAGLRDAAGRWHAPAIVGICPPSPAFEAAHAGLTPRLEQALRVGVDSLPSVHLVAPGEFRELYAVADYYDPHAEELGRVPYTPEFFAALGTLLARKIDALRRAPYKVIVLDCDETLWKGVCAEDGPLGVRLDPDRRALQEFMRAQHDAGVLLALCSKNEEEDVVETFRSNPEMPLQLDDFVARRINWEPKSANLAALAEELSLGLDSFIFVDDNETECAEVAANCPEALTLALPHENVSRFLRHVWAFDRLKTTREDRDRAAMYAQNLERARLEKRSLSLAAFIEALQLEIRIQPMTQDELPRIAQLTQRTNQMNFTVVRRSELDIRDALRSGAECLTVHVSDRFGGYGLVGVMLFGTRANVLAIDTFLLSCRALGKGVEHRMLARLGEIARDRALAAVEALFVQAPRNRPALDFLRKVGIGREQPRDGGVLFVFPAAELAGVRYEPATAPRCDTAPARKAASSRPAGRRDIDYGRIATELHDPVRIVEAARDRRERRAPVRAANGAPQTDLERDLATLWAELLVLPKVGVHDNFFDLGGHSLLAVQLISRVRQTYDVELSLELVYGGAFTVTELAKAIEVAQIEKSGDYSALLAEIEALSDEEVRALLEKEHDAAGSK